MKAKLMEFWSHGRAHFLPIVLVGIFFLFIAIMIGVYVVARQANPVLLDEKGQPKTTQTNGY